MKKDQTKDTVCISGLWMRTFGTRIQVLVEVAGGWYVVINDYIPPGAIVDRRINPAGIVATVELSEPDDKGRNYER